MPPKTIIVTDDEPFLTYTIAHNLRKAGFTVHTAENGNECLMLAFANPPDLIISDFDMPGLNGKALSERLKQDPRTACVPVILLTGHSRADIASCWGKANIAAYLLKPFSSRQLLAQVVQVLTARDREVA